MATMRKFRILSS